MWQKVGNKVTKLGIALVLALVACTLTPAQDVTTNSMPGTDFSKFHTYKWVAIEGATQPNQILDAQIKASIDSQLAAKGLTKDRRRQSRPPCRLSDLPRSGKTVERLRHGRRAPLGRRDGNGHKFHNQHRHSRPRYVRPLHQETRLDGPCHQDPRSRQQPGEETEESRQGHAEVAEELPTQIKIET